jgi:hypothetical protein
MHGCLYFCIVLSCVGRGLFDGLITRPRSPTKCLITERLVSGGRGPYNDCRATDDNDDDNDDDDCCPLTFLLKDL